LFIFIYFIARLCNGFILAICLRKIIILANFKSLSSKLPNAFANGSNPVSTRLLPNTDLFDQIFLPNISKQFFCLAILSFALSSGDAVVSSGVGVVGGSGVECCRWCCIWCLELAKSGAVLHLYQREVLHLDAAGGAAFGSDVIFLPCIFSLSSCSINCLTIVRRTYSLTKRSFCSLVKFSTLSLSTADVSFSSLS
jgi:hypothetical protein